MISASTLTYKRYNDGAGFSYKPHPTDKDDAKSERVESGKVEGSLQRRARRRSLFGTTRHEVETPTTNLERLNDLVDRLNARIHPDGRSLRFRLQEGRSPGIIMERDDMGVVSRYMGEAVSYLEDHLHDMAGLHFSVLS